MKALLRQALLPIAASTFAAVTPAPASAALLPFEAGFDGTAQVVEVVNPTGPVLRFETQATGSGSFSLVSYFSTDVIDMSTGVGTGSNVFVAGNGDELHGSFNVQVIPTVVANIVDLFGLATFSGGTGMFSGASGSAQLIGSGEFTSPTSAIARLVYRGSINVVPEPGTWLLLATALAALIPGRRRRRAPSAPVAAPSGLRSTRSDARK